MARNSRQKKNKTVAKETETAGPSWFHMPAAQMTPELAKELKVIQLRNVLDPKQHYKKADKKPSKFLQIGSVIDAPVDYYSCRMTKKQRKTDLVDTLLKDAASKKYYKAKYNDIQSQKESGGRKSYHQKQLKAQPRWKKPIRS